MICFEVIAFLNYDSTLCSLLSKYSFSKKLPRSNCGLGWLAEHTPKEGWKWKKVHYYVFIVFSIIFSKSRKGSKKTFSLIYRFFVIDFACGNLVAYMFTFFGIFGKRLHNGRPHKASPQYCL